MRDWVLEPLGMNDSFFGPAVPAGVETCAASAHIGDNERIPGGRNRYLELAAAGFYSTVLDLVKVITMMNQGVKPVMTLFSVPTRTVTAT